MQKSLEVKKKCVPLQSVKENTRGSSSVGRAQPCQGWGREFEPRLPLQTKEVSRNADFTFEKISPDGVQSYVSRPCAQGRLFSLYTPPGHTDFSLKVGILRRTVHKSVELSLKAADLRTNQFSHRDLLPTVAGICAVATLLCTSPVPAGRALAS